ncbi:MAG: DUF4173 domain-containing protein [Lachnospiraceae bacterium]|nr:DUF4173 domain-containing protein [Lachnospiraceae bacterium]
MNNMNVCLLEAQACESAPKIEISKEQRSFLTHFTPHTIGCFLYALFYTFCLYRNMSGITYPFFIGGTLLYFAYSSKKYGVTAKRDNRFLWISLLILGTLTCLTDSWVFAFFNRALAFVLLCVLILDSYYESRTWDIGTHIKAGVYLCFGSLFRMFSFISDFRIFRKTRELLNTQDVSEEVKHLKDEKKAKHKHIIFCVAVGLVISFPAIIILLLLLCSADALFYELVCDIVTLDFLPDWEWDGSIFNIGFKIVLTFLITYGVWNYLHKNTEISSMAQSRKETFDPYIGITITSITALLYLVFCGVQIFGLFLGKLSLPEGYTYASYARQGFFQLTFVCAFNLLLVLGCLSFFGENKILKIILTVISACTYIMIFSSAYRMLLYISQYHLTLLRVFVLWALAVMFIMMAGVIYYIYHRQFPLFRFFLTITTVGYLLLSASHPDYWIARYNVTQAESIQDLDQEYLIYTLSLDTAPFIYSEEFLDKCEELGWESFYKKYIYQVQFATEDMSWRTYNFSRAYAQNQLYKIDPDNKFYFIETE